jgi:glycosyltransferase involved in cell wall biosynthesis
MIDSNNNTSMDVGLHYHIPSKLIDGKIYTKAFFGVFVDSIAKKCKTLTYYSYTALKEDSSLMDYVIISKNVKLYDLGKLNRLSFLRFFFNSNRRKLLISSLNKLDMTLVRAPTALVYVFNKVLTPISVLLIGDFPTNKQLNELSLISNIYNRILYKWMESNQKKLLQKSIVFANNELLFNKVKLFSKQLFNIKTSTISKEDVFIREDTCQQDTIKLLFVGRIEESKGLYELYEALAAVKKTKYNFHLSIVGWVIKNEFLNELDEYAKRLKIYKNISNLGYVKLGNDLFKIYRTHDIFVLPTKFDAFPRTITEAMSQSLPVITTKVGGIPMRLTNKKNALLVNPGQSDELTKAITTLISNDSLRKSMINEGVKLAKLSTLESQSKIMFEKLSEFISLKN